MIPLFSHQTLKELFGDSEISSVTGAQPEASERIRCIYRYHGLAVPGPAFKAEKLRLLILYNVAADRGRRNHLQPGPRDLRIINEICRGRSPGSNGHYSNEKLWPLDGIKVRTDLEWAAESSLRF